ncbi:hypothetical protein HHK36_019669 [Tetracentron sinense]|uniref:Las1-like protein n=1 Tax=Tetracentron sinense TaxID=13715 RepID=A0A835DCZ2_TETSI|nr:hypothetical protein HHK36_019669 [Tetracentron sinense]
MESLLGFQERKDEEGDKSLGYKLVPWLSWIQWNFVSVSLFSSSPDSVAAALKRVSAWRSRGCLPIAIEVTASIVEIQQKDPFFREDSTLDALHSEEMLAMLYCMAIMRLVNGVVEKTRKKTEVSIAEAADAIGIPRMLIDIRHEGSHRDLPSLQLVRLASVKALEWLKYYYWEPQKNAIPYQRDGTANVRKEIKVKLQELVFYKNLKHARQSGSSLIKERRLKQRELLRGHNKFFSRMAQNFRSSKSEGYKKHISRTLRNLVQLYSSFPSEVISVLLELLLKACDSSVSTKVESSDNSLVDPSLRNSKTLTGTIDDWKLVIMRLSSKVPEVQLTMMKEILEMIETREAMKSEIGHHLPSSQHRAGIRQIEHLSSLVTWLVRNLKEAKPMQSRGSAAEFQVSSTEADVPKVTLTELIQKCLLVSALGNIQLMDSALLLAQMIGNSAMIEKLKKLSLLSLPSLDCTDEISNQTDAEDILLYLEDSIGRAAEKLEFLKLSRMKAKMVNTAPSNDEVGKEKTTWTVANSWKPCPIGTLPRAFGSSGVLPVLDRVDDQQEIQELSESKEHWELNPCRSKRDASCDVELLENSKVVKKMRETIEDGRPEGDDVLSLGSVKGRLMIGGVWKKVGEEEMLAIESAVRILV